MKIKRSINTRHALLATTGLCAFLLAGCGGGGSSDPATQPEPQPTPETMRSLTVDASAGGFPPDPAIGFTYVDLDSGTVLPLSDDEAAQSTDWDIALRRTQIKLNGGVSGPGSVKAAIARTPDGFYDANGNPNVAYFQDPNINPDSMLGELDAVSRADTESLTYVQDRYIPYISNDGGENSWFLYDFATHRLSANSDLWWILRSGSSDSFAKMNVVALDQAARQITVDFFVQAAGASGFEVNPLRWQASLPDAGGQTCYDFDAASEVGCDTGQWDLMFEIDGRSWSLWTQSEPKGQGRGGAFGPINVADIGGYDNASAVPGFFPDGQGGVFADDETTYNWALYAQQKMWPNYRVYAVDTGDGNRYGLQVTGYYSPETGASGHYSIRYRALD